MKPSELNADQRAKLIEQYRNVNVDSSWWHTDVRDNFAGELAAKGFAARDIQFSGFWCQGDGASFCGEVNEWTSFLNNFAGDLSQYPMIVKRVASNDCRLKLVRSSSNYSHENTVGIELEIDNFDEAGDDFQQGVVEAWNQKLAQELESFEPIILDALRSEMRGYYRSLETEYEYQTSDEQVWDFIVNNLDEIDGTDLELIEDI